MTSFLDLKYSFIENQIIRINFAHFEINICDQAQYWAGVPGVQTYSLRVHLFWNLKTWGPI